MRATLELLQTGAVAGMQDMGAAGFTSSACEMAARAGTGIEINVRRVPKVDETVQPFEVNCRRRRNACWPSCAKARSRWSPIFWTNTV